MRFPLIILLLPLALLSCTSGIDPGPCRSIECFESVFTLLAEESTESHRDSVVEIRRARAEFHSPEWRDRGYPGLSTAAGGVQFNGSALLIYRTGSVFYENISPAQDVPIAPAGAFNVWEVAGNDNIPSFTDSVRTPHAPMRILSPRPDDTVSLKRGFTLRWVPDRDAPDREENVIISFQTGRAEQGTSTVIHVADSAGMLEIKPGMLDRLEYQPGNLMIQVSRSYRRDNLVAEQYRYSMIMVRTERVYPWLDEE